MVCWFIVFDCFWQCLTWSSTFKFVCYTVFISFEFPFSYKLYICFIYCFIFSIIFFKYPFTIVFYIYVLCFCRLSRNYICFIYITILVCWFIVFDCFWQCLTWSSTFKFVCYTVFISFEFPFSYKLYICFIYCFIFSIIFFKYPFTIVFYIYVLCFCRLSRNYICFIYITILVCWFIVFDCFWQCLTWSSTFKFVCYTVFISFEFPFSYKLYICFIYCFIFSIIFFKYPFTIVFYIYVLCFCRLSRNYICFIYITILVCWFIVFDCFWQCLTWRSTFEFVCYTVFISLEFPFSYKLYICLIYCFIFSIVALEYPFSIVFCIYVLCFCRLSCTYIIFVYITI